MPEESQNVAVPQTNNLSVLDKPVTNPLAKNPNFYTHKVFATIGLILIVSIVILGGVWYYVQNADEKATQSENSETTKVATSSAKTATAAATKDETADWLTISNTKCGFSVKHPKDWSTAKVDGNTISLRNVDELGGDTPQVRIAINCEFTDYNNSLFNKVETYEVGKTVQVKPDYQVDKEMDTYTRLADTVIDGAKVVRTEKDLGYKDVDVSDTYMLFIVKYSKIYYANILGGIKLDAKVKLLDQILSTFKFL